MRLKETKPHMLICMSLCTLSASVSPRRVVFYRKAGTVRNRVRRGEVNAVSPKGIISVASCYTFHFVSKYCSLASFIARIYRTGVAPRPR